MKTDTAERLRGWAAWDDKEGAFPGDSLAPLLRAAADEIDRLRRIVERHHGDVWRICVVCGERDYAE